MQTIQLDAGLEAAAKTMELVAGGVIGVGAAYQHGV
jgi:hypothetical protein